MRCYLTRTGHIAAVEFLNEGPDDALIEQAKVIFIGRAADGSFDGFEVWDGGRRLYVHPQGTPQAAAIESAESSRP